MEKGEVREGGDWLSEMYVFLFCFPLSTQLSFCVVCDGSLTTLLTSRL